jgi:hypothetical protein
MSSALRIAYAAAAGSTCSSCSSLSVGVVWHGVQILGANSGNAQGQGVVAKALESASAAIQSAM